MSAPASSKGHTVSRASERSSTARGKYEYDDSAMPTIQALKYFDPCGATASMFLYAQGSSIVCCHHDSLAIERRFTGHKEEVVWLSIDNQSEKGAGRLVVSYDTSRIVIIWDLMTGDTLHEFQSLQVRLTAVSWMRNGNVAFGNENGCIILFEPTTQEHISYRTLEQTAITALAPSGDNRTFAVGFQTGSLLIVTLQPRFQILHNLTTSRGPSPVINLAWHASSSRQKSEMLAVQKHDGDLRVWSVAKNYSVEEPAKVVRILRKAEALEKGCNWMGWSKNGRVIQFSDKETLSWDVRTKHVTFDSIPTLEHVRGLALYGPGATLFTVGPNGTAQQFDLNSPSIMVANVQHPTSHLPPSPPNSIEETANKSVHSVTTIHTSESESSIPLEMNVSESDEDHLSPFARITRGHAPDSSGNETYESASPVSSRSGLSSSLSKSSAGSRTPGRHAPSLRSQNTYISAGTSLRSSTIGRQQEFDNYSMGYDLATNSSVASSRSRHRPSRLRNEVPRSPDDNKVHDLFKFTRTRLSDIQYKHPMNADNSRLTNDDLRKQMLSTIFGWHGEVEDLIRDEMTRHPSGSSSRILLAKWLGDIETDLMAGSAQNMTSSDWMLLALSGIGGEAGQQKLGRAYVQRLLESGDIHVAVTIMLGMGDHNDAIEIYVSHKRYMEALLLTCLAFPGVWERQSAIIRKWGEYSIQHHQQQLAIRCFACTDQESTEPWRSPSATQLNFASVNHSIPEVLSPPLSPPGLQRGPQRSVAKSSSLRLITSFNEAVTKSAFYNRLDGGQTPIAAGVTPIADSAISPGGSYEAATAFLRPSSNSRFNTPTSARPGGSTTSRGRLPSIGEAPSDINRDALVKQAEKYSSRRTHSRMASADYDNIEAANSLPRAATASPMMMRDRHARVVTDYQGDGRPPSPDQNVMARMKESKGYLRNGSRDRVPGTLQLNHVGHPPTNDPTSPEQSVASSTRFHWPSRRRGPGSVASSITSNSSAGRSYRNGRQRDDYIHSLEAAKHYPRNSSRGHSKDRARDGSRTRHGSRERRDRSREPSEDRGRASARSWARPKRSPTSPIPMSPEDLANLSTPKTFAGGDPSTARKSTKPRTKGSSRTSSRGSKRSPSGRRTPLMLDTRGRSQGRESAGIRSPSSPVPLSANLLQLQGSEDEEDLKRAMQEQEAFRARHSRSVSQGLNSPAASKRGASESRRRDNAEALDVLPPLTLRPRAASTEHAGDLRQEQDNRIKRKEQAARELEDRRKSLAQRAHTPGIVHPDAYSSSMAPMPGRIAVESADPKLPEDMPPRSATEPPKMYNRNGAPIIGLPGTPKAMRLVLSNGMGNNPTPDNDIPPLPQLSYKEQTPQTAKEEKGGDLLTLLPSTVYQPPARPMIPRSMSAPIPDDPPHFRRKMSTGGIPNIAAVVRNDERRHSDEEPLPPPPPPVPTMPPMLKELQHLAKPPPPPPAPLPHVRPMYGAGGAVGSGMIEIVMDDDDQPPVAAPNDGMVPVLSPPVPPPSRGHNRGRSVGGEGSISGRSRRGSERRSRSRKDSRAQQPTLETLSGAVYQQGKSFTPAPPPVLYDQDAIRSPVDKKGKHMSTGLHRSEMI